MWIGEVQVSDIVNQNIGLKKRKRKRKCTSAVVIIKQRLLTEVVISPLTKLVLEVHKLVVFHILVLAEEVFEDVAATKEPNITVVCNSAMGEFSPVQSSTLGLSFHRGHQEGDTKEAQEFLKM